MNDQVLIFERYLKILGEAGDFSKRDQHNKFHKQKTAGQAGAANKEAHSTYVGRNHAMSPEELHNLSKRLYNKNIEKGKKYPLTTEYGFLKKEIDVFKKMKKQRQLDKLFQYEENGDIMIPFFQIPNSIQLIFNQLKFGILDDESDKKGSELKKRSIKTLLSNLLLMMLNENVYRDIYEDSNIIIKARKNQESETIVPKETYDEYKEIISQSILNLENDIYDMPNIILPSVKARGIDTKGHMTIKPFTTAQSKRSGDVVHGASENEFKNRRDLRGLPANKLELEGDSGIERTKEGESVREHDIKRSEQIKSEEEIARKEQEEKDKAKRKRNNWNRRR